MRFEAILIRKGRFMSEDSDQEVKNFPPSDRRPEPEMKPGMPPDHPEDKPHGRRAFGRFMLWLLVFLAMVLAIAIVFMIDTSNKSDWLSRQKAHIDTLYSERDRLLENMSTFTGMLPPQRTDWSEQDRKSFDQLNTQELDIENQIDEAISDYNTNLTIWSKPFFSSLEKSWGSTLDSESQSK